MPSTSQTVQNIGITNKNENQPDALIDMTVIGNYGDPGLNEDFQFDLLSTFLICAIESSNRTVTQNRFDSLIVVVKRPQNLWIEYQGGIASSTATQIRVDNNLNANVGQAGNFSTNVIPQINIPYNMGDTIKAKLIKNTDYPSVLMGDTFFQSADNRWTPTQQSYYSWYNQGASLPYIANQMGGLAALQQKTITPYGSNSLNLNTNGDFFYICLNKVQYESFCINQYPTQTADLINLFTNQSNFNSFYQQNGGYYFSQNTSYNFCSVQYEDANLAGRKRETTTSCIPTVVVSPSSFVVPSVRAIGTVNYSPTYILQS
jgi:hypothetical protein